MPKWLVGYGITSKGKYEAGGGFMTIFTNTFMAICNGIKKEDKANAQSESLNIEQDRLLTYPAWNGCGLTVSDYRG